MRMFLFSMVRHLNQGFNMYFAGFAFTMMECQHTHWCQLQEINELNKLGQLNTNIEYSIRFLLKNIVCVFVRFKFILGVKILS